MTMNQDLGWVFPRVNLVFQPERGGFVSFWSSLLWAHEGPCGTGLAWNLVAGGFQVVLSPRTCDFSH